MFAWPIYYETNLNSEASIKKINEAKFNEEKLSALINETIIDTQEYLKNYSDIIIHSGYSKLPEKFVLSEVARVWKQFIINLNLMSK